MINTGSQSLNAEMVDSDRIVGRHYFIATNNIPNSTSTRDSEEKRDITCFVANSSNTDLKNGTKVAVHICYPQLRVDLTGRNNFANVSATEFPFDVLASPPLRKRTSQVHKNKTPNTVKMLMEKHRDNERMRHHSLNEHLRMICQDVPGSADEGKETKVVMMQRIISYISYLENTAKYMCDQLGIETDPSILMLTSSTHDIDYAGSWIKEFGAPSSDESKDSDFFMKSMTRRLKLSSPTIDSTTDSASKSSYSFSVKDSMETDNSQDSTVPTSSVYIDREKDVNNFCDTFLDPAEEVVIMENGNFDSILDKCGDQSVPELPSSTFETSLLEPLPDIQWLGSPDISFNMPQNKVGITCDPRVFDDPSIELNHATVVSPNQILEASYIKEELMDIDSIETANIVSFGVQKDMIRTPRANKRKQDSPKRAPLFDMSNWADVQLGVPHQIKQDWIEFVSPEPVEVIGNVVEVISSAGDSRNGGRDWCIHTATKEELEQVSNAVLQEAKLESVTKLDLRKSSWMNGFMMFSRIHRRRFIKENPGIHTGSISKMLGNTWRAMNEQQQAPYREQARICAQGLQRLLDESLRAPSLAHTCQA